MKRLRHIHLIGIGGAGMSAFARILKERGYHVTGSDIHAGEVTDRLVREGIVVHMGHRSRHVEGADEVIFSTAIFPDNAELKAARKKKIPVLHRAEALANFMRDRKSVVITGMHGKTTTTGLAAHLCVQAGWKPGYLVGADCPTLNGGACAGQGDYFVAEGDESDGSFLHYRPRHAIVTNIDREHLDHYGNIRNIRSAFGKFFKNTQAGGGELIVSGEDPHIRMLLARSNGEEVLRYGWGAANDIWAEDVRMEKGLSVFTCRTPEGVLGRFRFTLPGRHNVLNALAVIALGWKLGCAPRIMIKALQTFKGVRRRFEIKLLTSRLMVVDDYAHHPAEIDAVLACCRRYRRRVVGVFQPHRYSRTKHLAGGFGRSLAGLDELVLMDIYGADEKPLRGITVDAIRRSARAHGLKNIFVERRRVQILKRLHQILRPRDLVITLGAGDVGELSDALVKSDSF